MRLQLVVACVVLGVLPLFGCSHADGQTWNASWNLPSQGPNARTLYVLVDESTLNRSSPCWIRYTTRARWTGTRFDVTAYATTTGSDVTCNDVGVAAYAIVHLPKPYAGEPIRDTRTDHIERLAPRQSPAPRQIVN